MAKKELTREELLELVELGATFTRDIHPTEIKDWDAYVELKREQVAVEKTKAEALASIAKSIAEGQAKPDIFVEHIKRLELVITKLMMMAAPAPKSDFDLHVEKNADGSMTIKKTSISNKMN